VKSQRRIRIAALVGIAMLTALLPTGAAGQTFTPIHDIQGSGLATPVNNQFFTVQAVVVGDFQVGGIGGFYLQEEAADHDADPLTSEGIFVFSSTAVAAGDLVQLTGRAGEFGGQTQLSSVTGLSILQSGVVIDPTPISLPVADANEFERYEGMLVTFEQDLYISEYFNFDRFNEIVLTAARQFQPTEVAEPGSAEAAAVLSSNLLSRITLDDGRTSQNSNPALHPDGNVFDLTNTFRGGDILQDVTGVMGHAFNLYRIQPTQGATHVVANPRPTAPDPIDGTLRIASFNVLNFFTTLDLGVDVCGPTGNLECRGADTVAEYERQLAKLLVGIQALDADVIGIQEIENDIRADDGDRAHDPILTLVEELNEVEGPGTWAWIGELDHYNDYPIRNEMIYRPAAVSPVGSPQTIADDAFDVSLPGIVEPLGRPPVAQTFRPVSGSQQPFTVVVNHFKSKSSSCAVLGDPNTGDGQGDCNLTRVAQAEALLDFIDVLDDTSSGVLTIGDYNSYMMEDPIDTLVAGGLTNLVARFDEEPYTLVFDGQLGTLDHALATRSMLNWVKGLTIFHINVDEPDILDYDMSFKQPAQDALFEPLPYRVSDHDPVIVGITLPGR
jgi:predicted extracellular nuclease